MKIVTHSGHFHADELLAVAALLIKYPDAEVVRSRDEKIIETADIAVDVGLLYDPEHLRFDHHQPGGAGERPNGIPYASFGLIWKQYGDELAGGSDEAKVLEEKIAMPIDATDNGVSLYTSVFDGVKEYSLGDYFESFSYGTKTLEDSERQFRVALDTAKEFLNREIEETRHTVESWREVKRAYEASKNKEIIILDKILHWKRVLIPTEAKYVVYPRSDGQWDVGAVSKNADSYERKKPFPTSWAGLTHKTLRDVSGVDTAIFCHRDRWLAVAETKEGAIKLAELALNS